MAPATALTSTGSGNITFDSTVDGPTSLAVNTAGTTTFAGAVGGGSPLAKLTTDLPGLTVLGAAVTTTGDLTINDPLVLTANVTLIDAAASGAGITLSTVNSDSANQRVLTTRTSLNVATGTIGPHVTYNPETLTGLTITVTPAINSVNVSNVAVPVTVTATTDTAFQNVIVTGPPVPQTSGTLVVQTPMASSVTTSVDLSSTTTPVVVTVAPNASNVVVTGNPVNNTFTMTGIQGNNVTFEGGSGVNIFVPTPSGGFNVTLVDPPGATDTVDLTQAEVPFISKTTNTEQQLGVQLDLTMGDGQPQLVYQTQLTNPDIGSFVDPSLLTSTSQASLSLKGSFQTVIVGSGARLFAAPSGYNPITGTRCSAPTSS